MSMSWWDKMMVDTYFRHMELIKEYGWIAPRKETSVNLSLLQRPKKVKAGTRALFIYSPSELTTSVKLKPGCVVGIVDVFEGDTPEETTLKVMEASDLEEHIRGYYDESACIAWRSNYNREENPCHCHKDPSEMPESLRDKVHYVLLTDIGK